MCVKMIISKPDQQTL